MKKRKYLSDDEKQAVIAAYVQGEPIKAIANRFAVCGPTISRIVSNKVIKRKPVPVTPADKQAIADAYSKGEPTLKICITFNVTRPQISRIAKEAGFPLREKRYTGEQKQAIINNYLNGKSMNIIANELNTNSSTIYYILVAANVDIKSRKSSIDAYVSEIITAYINGSSSEKIAKDYNCSTQTILNFLRKNGTSVRSAKQNTSRNWTNSEIKTKYLDKITPSGDKHPNWQGGKTTLSRSIRNSTQYTEWRLTVFTRDNFTCQQCCKGGTLQADHIYPFSAILDDYGITTREQAMNCEVLWDVTNGRTLCKDCHKKTDTYGAKAARFTGRFKAKTQQKADVA